MKFFLNTFIAALIIAGVAEIGKRSSYAGAVLVALPFTSILALAFLYFETGDVQKISNLSYGIFWLVLPTLLFFLLLPFLLKAGLNFWVALAATSAFMTCVFIAYSWVLRKFGILI